MNLLSLIEILESSLHSTLKQKHEAKTNISTEDLKFITRKSNINMNKSSEKNKQSYESDKNRLNNKRNKNEQNM